MPTVAFDSKSLIVRDRRAWIVGAGMEYALCEPEGWGQRLDQLRRAGVNTVLTSAPWIVHEPRPGRFRFEGRGDLRGFLEACAERQLWVILRIGPSVGEPYDGGGIPSWVVESGVPRLREHDPAFLERVSALYREIAGRLDGLQATEVHASGRRRVGPVLAVQVEHRWWCDNEEQEVRYLGELVRFARECGIKVPLLTANGQWRTVETAIDCWEEADQLLAGMRQLATVQDRFPRIAIIRDPLAASTWGEAERDAADFERRVRGMPRNVAEVLAAGGMPIVADAVGGMHAEGTAGRRAPRPPEPGAFFSTLEPRGILVDAHGDLRPESAELRRLLRFGSSFGHVFADAEVEHQPVVVNPDGGDGDAVSVAGARGPGGEVTFVFARRRSDRRLQLVLGDGRGIGVDLGDGEVGWFPLEVDLRGKGRLDYSTLSPLGMFGRRMLVVFGPEGTLGALSIDGAALEVRVPGRGEAPLVAEHRDLTIVVLNEAQSLTALPESGSLRIGVDSIASGGREVAARGVKEIARIEASGKVDRGRPSRGEAPVPKRASSISLGDWERFAEPDLVEGGSHRFASLDGPSSLRGCGVGSGYGWYLVRIRQPKSGRLHLDMPGAGDRLRVHLDGRPLGIFGSGPDATPFPTELPLSAGDHKLVVLAEDLGRGSDGAACEERRGIFGPIVETRPLKGVKTTYGEVPPLDPFSERGYLHGLVRDAPPPEEGFSIRWTLRRRPTLLLDLGAWPVPAMVFVNERPLKRLDGDESVRTVLEIAPDGDPGSKIGSNEVLIVPDEDVDLDPKRRAALARGVRMWEVVRELGGPASWWFARWRSAAEVAEEPTWGPLQGGKSNAGKGGNGGPAWFRTTVKAPAGAVSAWLDLSTMSSGTVVLGDRPLGRYLAKSGGREIGPSRLPLPMERVAGGTIDLLIFDEEGRSPAGIRVVDTP